MAMLSRRKFLLQSSFTGMAFGIVPVEDLLAKEEKELTYQSDFIRLRSDPTRPQLTWFSTDSLGQAKFAASPLSDSQGPKSDIVYRSKIGGIRSPGIPAPEATPALAAAIPLPGNCGAARSRSFFIPDGKKGSKWKVFRFR